MNNPIPKNFSGFKMENLDWYPHITVIPHLEEHVVYVAAYLCIFKYIFRISRYSNFWIEKTQETKWRLK